MASINIRHAFVEFPIYQGGGRSLKKTLMRAGTGGRIVRDATARVSVKALSDINLNVEHGDRIGLVGHNGAGKTTLLRVMAGTYEPSAGVVLINGRVAPLFDASLGLDPDATGYENITFRGLYMGLSPREIKRHMEDIAEFTELGDYLAMPIKTYSSGMLLRLAFAVATCIEPEILLMDEWLLAGDAKFLEKARQRIAAFVSRSSILVLASHADDIVRAWCSRAIWLERGRVRLDGPVGDVLSAYQEASHAG